MPFVHSVFLCVPITLYDFIPAFYHHRTDFIKSICVYPCPG